MRVGIFLILYVVLGTGAFMAYHAATHHGGVNGYQAAMAFFLVLNFLICLWEIALGKYITHIHKEYLHFRDVEYKKPSEHINAVVRLFTKPMSAAEMLSLKFWSTIWSTYALYDNCYANRESYGFFIDVGNGWTTLLPTVAWLVGMTNTFGVGARWFGIIGLVSFYQEWYGTVIYFFQYCFNGRYKGRAAWEVALFVGLSNGIWFGFPVLGMYLSVDMIFTDSFDILRL